MEQTVKNILVCEETDNTLFYCLTLTPDEVRRFCEANGIHPVDVVEVRDDELQYYIIGGRVWCDTQQKEAAVRKRIA